jgi:hypothetical protein
MTRPKQLDLFAQLAQPVRWTQDDRQKAMTLLRELLREAMIPPGTPNQQMIGKEARDDQDHL